MTLVPKCKWENSGFKLGIPQKGNSYSHLRWLKGLKVNKREYEGSNAFYLKMKLEDSTEPINVNLHFTRTEIISTSQFNWHSVSGDDFSFNHHLNIDF